ncbi:hypothetical protein MKEN_00627700 [Mycena kentingensis (nom. inval.)]|nr:hypothetical protein MKEN_00627700 [Mycena kentingensis (nom. inval.)]
MRFTLSLSFLTLAASALGAAVEAHVNVDPQTSVEYVKYIGIHDTTLLYSAGCASVTNACLKENGTSIWSHSLCVAAAGCQGTRSVITLNQCQNPNVLVASSIPNLSSATWTSITGSSSGRMSQQNFIDFVYGAMSTAGVTSEWPTVDDVIQYWWTPIVEWTAAGETIPYANFND